MIVSITGGNGTRAVNKRGRGYSFQWDIGGTSFSGVGLQNGDKAAVGFGGRLIRTVSFLG